MPGVPKTNERVVLVTAWQPRRGHGKVTIREGRRAIACGMPDDIARSMRPTDLDATAMVDLNRYRDEMDEASPSRREPLTMTASEQACSRERGEVASFASR